MASEREDKSAGTTVVARSGDARVPERFAGAPASRDVVKLFGFSHRTARGLLSAWADGGFVVVADPAKKSRKNSLAAKFRRTVLS
jgi:hypothetical protein